MKHLYSVLFVACLSACAGSKDLPRQPERDVRPGLENPANLKHSEPGNIPEPKRDAPFAASNYSGQKKGFLDGVFSRNKQETQKKAGQTASIKKCKGCTFNTATAPGARAQSSGDTKVKDGAYGWESATNAGKGATQATGNATATDNTKAGQRGGAAATGEGASATATTEKPGFPWGWAIGASVACIWAIGASLTNSWGWPLRLFS